MSGFNRIYHNKKVVVTGHTGFKGSWLSLWLQNMGAEVKGYSLGLNTEPTLFKKANIAEGMESEFGDILFALINYARFLKINPENALERTNKKFIYRFQYLEERAREEGKSLSEMTLDEMDVYWEEAKRK